MTQDLVGELPEPPVWRHISATYFLVGHIDHEKVGELKTILTVMTKYKAVITCSAILP